MPTLVCVPVFVESAPQGDQNPTDPVGSEPLEGGTIDADPIQAALDEALLARAKRADLVEFRIDRYFSGSESGASGDLDGDAADAYAVASLRRLLAESPLPVILTCRPTWEGGDYDGDDADRVALFEKLCCDTDAPPAYLDVELAAYTRSANLRQKINLCVAHPKQQRKGVTTRLILSTHDFEGRPSDLDRKLLAMYDEPACAVVKVAHRARSLRDNLDLFEILRESPKPTIALGMGEFGLMSRVLAPKFNGFLTFASLRDEAATAPGQPTIDDLLGMYRFRSIGKQTRLYGVIGWPVGHSLSPLIHNAGFAEIGWDGVYLPLPIAADEKDAEASRISLTTTISELSLDEHLRFEGASVTLPHKVLLVDRCESWAGLPEDQTVESCGAANTLTVERVVHLGPRGFDIDCWRLRNTDVQAIEKLLLQTGLDLPNSTVGIIGAGGVARAAAMAAWLSGTDIVIFARNEERAQLLVSEVGIGRSEQVFVEVEDIDALTYTDCHVYINCTPVGMAGGPDPDGLSIPIPGMTNIDQDTVFFDTVYNPVETPMLKAARTRGCRTIDGVEMFVKQAAAQFELWTGKPPPIELFDRLCREKLATSVH